SDVRDESDLKGLKIAIDLKRGADPDTLMKKLFKMTPLQDSFGCNFNILIDAKPVVMGVRDIIKEWLKFRMECIRNSLEYDIDKKSKKLHLLTGLKKILLDIDKAVSIIRHTEHESDVVPNLMTGFSIDESQAEYIAEIRLRNLNREYILNRTEEIENLIEDIDNMRMTLESEARIKNIIKEDLKRISKKYGTERKTIIIPEDEDTDDFYEDEIEDYPLTFFITKENYIKKVPAQSLRASNGVHKLKENDEIVQTVETTNKSEILFFTDNAVVYKMRMRDIADSKISNMGEYIPSLIGCEPEEKILYTVVTSDYSGMMIFGFENGKMAKILLDNYKTKTNRRKLIGAYSDKSPICDIRFTREDTVLVAFASDRRALVVNTEKIPLKATKNTQGVQVMSLKKKAVMIRVQNADESGIVDMSHYTTKNLPAAGNILKQGDEPERQTTLF
ncbi:MAG: topoisomerase IV, partial [Oscillospiraceae bacterium]|nr:topoisomerase IV [Oscillospiraceae bacterium]